MLSNHHFSLKEASDTQDAHKSIGGLLPALRASPNLRSVLHLSTASRPCPSGPAASSWWKNLASSFLYTGSVFLNTSQLKATRNSPARAKRRSGTQNSTGDPRGMYGWQLTHSSLTSGHLSGPQRPPDRKWSCMLQPNQAGGQRERHGHVDGHELAVLHYPQKFPHGRSSR